MRLNFRVGTLGLRESGACQRATMPLFKFGQPVGAVCQLGYIVEDIHRAMERFTQALHAGPWFFVKDVRIKNASYRGRPFEFHGSLAAGNTGHTMIELIQQADDTPSIFTEVVNQKGYGLHHQAILVRDFHARIKACEALGYEVAFYSETDMPSRNAFLDTRGDLPFLLEVIDATDALENVFTGIYRASIEWTGEHPIRDFVALNDPKQFK